MVLRQSGGQGGVVHTAQYDSPGTLDQEIGTYAPSG
jgi:hypothetical protein